MPRCGNLSIQAAALPRAATADAESGPSEEIAHLFSCCGWESPRDPPLGPSQQVYLGAEWKRKMRPSSGSLSLWSPGYCLTGNEQNCTQTAALERSGCKSSPGERGGERKSLGGGVGKRKKEKRRRKEAGAERRGEERNRLLHSLIHPSSAFQGQL